MSGAQAYAGPSYGALPREARESLREFEAFQAELDGVRGRLERGETPDGADPGREAFSPLHRRLAAMGAGKAGTLSDDPTRLERAYVLASFADEALIHMTRWGGAQGWPGLLLERALYGTRIAGERVFEAAEALVARRDPSRRDLAMTLFLALSCGFRGRWRGIDDQGALARLRHDLFELATDLDAPGDVSVAEGFAAVHAHTATGPSAEAPRDVERWLLAMLGVVVGWLALSHMIWALRFADVSDLTRQIIAMARP